MKLSDIDHGIPSTPVEQVGLDGKDANAHQAFWDQAAQVDAVGAISDRDTEESFEASGKVDAEYLRPFLPASGCFLEIGCGIGRVLQHVAPMCREAHGIDISREMVRRGEERLQHLLNVRFHHGNGYDLEPFEDETFDVVYCGFVFQHMPKTSVYNYLVEAYRVLKPNGVFRFQVPNLLLDEHFSAFHHFTTPYFFHKPFPMYFFTPSEIVKMTTEAGFWVEDLRDDIMVLARKRQSPGISAGLARGLDQQLLEARVDELTQEVGELTQEVGELTQEVGELTQELDRIRNYPVVRSLRLLRRFLRRALPGR
jgi:SAM-dependent methyltransferase